jgi:CheY-like chemotaxis protein
MPNNLKFPLQVLPMCKVLVIDDERMIRQLVEEVLQRMNYSVETAEDGRRGIDLFDSGRFDLVITDVCMPETDGNRVVHHIRNSSRKHTPVIGMSGTPWETGRSQVRRRAAETLSDRLPY